MMDIERSETLGVHSPEEIVRVRQTARAWATTEGFSIVDQTKIVTAASELARNMLIYGGGGDVTLECISNGVRRGMRLVFVDHGPGIPDIASALRDGFTTGGGLGLGLGGSKRLMNEFLIESSPENGTSVTIIKWK
jgi:serine/threonine-protein kinase RsbT